MVGLFALFTVIGAPLVWVIWEAINALLLGRPGEVNYLVLLPVLLVFIVVVVLASRAVQRWDSRT